MFWEFPLKIQTLDTTTETKDYRTFETKEEFIAFMWEQFKLPGKYNLKNSIRFQDAGMQYTKTHLASGRPNFEGGYYTNAVKGTHKWKTYWADQKEKVLRGVIIDGNYLPPFYHWYLNFCPIYDDLKKKTRLPDVWDGDLWYMQYVMLCILLGKHVGGIKGRQKGYSYKHMAILYWSYSWFEASVNTIGAYDEKLVSKSWRFLVAYRKHINSTTAWKRGPKTAKALEWNEVQFDVNDNPRGLASKLVGVTFQKNPENDVGGSQTFFNYEEPGVSPTILETLEFVRPALEKGSETTGVIIACGSVGDLDDAKGIKEIFYKPAAYNFLPIKNIWDVKNPTDTCCIFISEAYNMIGSDKDGIVQQGRPFMDKDGNSDVEFALEWIAKKQEADQKSEKRHDLKQLALSQKCISPEQAFNQRKRSEFPAEEMIRQQERIRLKDDKGLWDFKPFKCLLYEDAEGEIKFEWRNLPQEHEYPIKPEWEDKRGVVTFYIEPPKTKPEWLTFFAGLDTVEVDETNSSESVVSLDIYQRTVKVVYEGKNKEKKIKYEGGKIVATYRGRFNPAEKTNEQCWLLIKLFNAFCYHDRSKPGFMNYMKRNGRAEKYLAKESDVPMFKDMNNQATISKSNYGFVISAHNKVWDVFKANMKEYFQQEFDTLEDEYGNVTKVFTGIDRTDDYWLLEEYIKWNEKDNFDRVVSSAAAITIGRKFEDEYGIPTRNEIKQEKPPERVVHAPRQINMLGGQVRWPNTNNPKIRKPKSLI